MRGYLSEDVPKSKREDKGGYDDTVIIGVDGEGQDTPDGRHIYTYLAAVDEFGTLVAEAYNEFGLSHGECVEMLLSLPKKALKFGFMFSYDVTKIIEDMPEIERYYLMRPKLRETKTCEGCDYTYSRYAADCPKCADTRYKKRMQPLTWGIRKYDYFNGSMTVRECYAKSDEGARSAKVWDCFRFFGCAFVEALKDWQIGTPEQVERISEMKQKRGAFDVEDPEAVKAYCREECELLAVMMRKVINAHRDADIPLKRFEGAGSTATALLKKNEVAEYKGPKLTEMPTGLARAIACAFFGGRFEDSVVGIVDGPAHGFDISSAYPFALSFLPCLRCGSWSLKSVKAADLKRIEKSGGLAVVQYRVRKVSLSERKKPAWCPLPFRDEKGSIAYGTNFTGWAWLPEVSAAMRGWPDLVELTGQAWVYKRECSHTPFGFLPKVYRQRVAWGKEGAGKALKLGSNATYGKTAQSVGDDPPFQSWVWAGMTTATTRGQLLDAIASAKDQWNVLAVATDGIYCLEELPIKDPPRDTGTSDLAKPLGGWEYKELPEGIFIAKPGLYWRLEPELSDIRARGVGRREAYKAREILQDGFLAWDRRDPAYCVRLQSRRFYGAKHSVFARSRCEKCARSWPGVPEERCPSCGAIGSQFETSVIKGSDGKPAYGLWGAREIKIAFDPYPKREREGISRGGKFARLRIRDLGGRDSAPYDVGNFDPRTTPEGMLMRAVREFELEQPDWSEGLGGVE